MSLDDSRASLAAAMGLPTARFDAPGRDQADFDPDELDEYLAGWVEGDRLVALAGGRPWPPRPGYHDRVVLMHPDARRAGCGLELEAFRWPAAS